ncbi:DUF2752 domain-containing protein [Streptomyces sp. NBC_00525]|uniref:DUF2752 domain-containing protein n=1 Tax=Streptomyces sp. NBC_00525 TaxID=2903660 RepID=UPI002E8102AF|nr:DUF2752 domain-containing protein [Streptomyces sp. NBC_00525]WUC93191.1 DUF2752 domain-containing protein [Streptomyces sp. NBC_00525]
MDASPNPAPAAPGPASGPPPLFPTAPAGASRLRRIAVPAGVLAAVIGAFGYVATVDPNQPGHYPVCPLLRFTGIYCPGCGGLRSAHAFAHGDLAAAFGANALAVAGYAIFAVLWAVWLVREVRGKPLRIGLRPVHWWAIGALLLVFTLVRNLPFGSALAP